MIPELGQIALLLALAAAVIQGTLPLIDSASLGLPCWARLSASAASGGM